MKTLLSLLMVALLASIIASGPLFAADFSGDTKASGQPFVHPPDDASYSKDMRDDEMLAKAKPADNGKVQYVSGGIAVSGMRAIDSEENLYNLKMLFVSKGEYMADVGVTIVDSKGTNILDATAQGPVLLVKMLPGDYTVSAKTSAGSTLVRHVVVSKDHLATYVLRYSAKAQ